MRKVFIGAVLLALVAAVAGAQSIVVVKPAAGQTVLKQESCQILWTKNGTMPNLVRISLRNSQTLAEIMLIQDNAPNSGSASWLVPANIPDGTYRIRVKVKNVAIEADSGAFPMIGAPQPGPAVIHAEPMAGKVPPLAMLKFPALSISGAALVSYEDSFRITFAYKNSGAGNLPKSSEMPVKPDFRVLVDGQVLNQGTLTIPAFPAPPGWEMPSFYGGEIKLQAPGEFDDTWTIGNTLDIRINENKINGMASDMKTYNLRQLALNYAFDAYINGATYDWKTETLTVDIRVDGKFEPNNRIRFFNTGRPGIFVDQNMGGFLQEYDLVSGQHYYKLSHKVHPPGGYAYKLDVYLGVLVLKLGSDMPDLHDVYHPNNNNHHFTFNR